MHDATRIVRAGIPEPAQGQPFLPGPTFAAPFHLSGDPSESQYSYGRHHNPTWTAYESAISDLEQAVTTTVFSSGMAALTAILGVTLKSGDLVLMPADGYYTGRALIEDVFTKFGVEVKAVATGKIPEPADLGRASLLWVETPSNPNLEVADIRGLAAAAHSAGTLLAVDNTTLSPLGQQPLALGADFSVASDTKITTGHSDIVLGHVSVRDQKLGERLQVWRKQTGSIAGPMEVWLAHRSLATLHVRMERQCLNALALAEFLSMRPDVSGVRYPGLRRDPSHALASRQMKFFGPIVSFVLKDRVLAERFLAACKLIYDSTSFGSVHTTAERRARWGGDAVPEGFIRLSVGCEDIGDLRDDLEQALDCARGA